MGTRSDVGSMFAIGSIKEDFLGFEIFILVSYHVLTTFQDSVICLITVHRICVAWRSERSWALILDASASLLVRDGQTR